MPEDRAMNTLHTLSPFSRRCGAEARPAAAAPRWLPGLLALAALGPLLGGCDTLGSREGKTWVETVGPRWPTTGSSRQDLVPPSLIKAASQPEAASAAAADPGAAAAHPGR